MSEHEEVPLANNENEKLKPGFLLKLGMLMSMPITDAIAITDKTNGGHLRHLLPEPLDIFSHAGNFFPSMILTAWPSMLASSSETIEESTKAKKIILTISALGAIAVNVLSETKFGVRLIGGNFGGTPDPIDAVYGSVAAIATAAAVYPRENEPN